MSVVSFFRFSLALPLILPLLLMPFGLNAVGVLLYLALGFGGLQYLLFALLMSYYIGKLRTERRIRHLSYWAPVMFVPIQALGWVLWAGYQWYINPNTSGVFTPLLPFAAYTIIIGYAYVGVVNIFYVLFRGVGWVNAPANP